MQGKRAVKDVLQKSKTMATTCIQGQTRKHAIIGGQGNSCETCYRERMATFTTHDYIKCRFTTKEIVTEKTMAISSKQNTHDVEFRPNSTIYTSKVHRRLC